MKITCPCGHILSDATDNLSYKAHFIPDQLWEASWDMIDHAIEKSGPTLREKENECRRCVVN